MTDIEEQNPVSLKIVNELLQRTVGIEINPSDDLDGAPVDELQKVRDILRDVMIKCIQNVEERFQVYSKKCVKLMEEGCINPKKVQRVISSMENYLMQKFREREPFIIEKDDSKRNHTHRQVLKNCYSSLIQDLDLKNTRVLDMLLQDDVMSVVDKDSIIHNNRTKGAQNEEFFRYIEGRLTFEEFNRSLVPALREDHSHLADMLLKEFDVLDESSEDSICVTCKVYKIVQVKRLATPLYHLGVIDSSLHADLKSAAITNTQKWSELEKSRVAHVHIINAMKTKYPDFYHEFKRENATKLECMCGANGSIVSGTFPRTASPIISGREPDQSTMSEGRESITDVAVVRDLEADLELHTVVTEFEYPMDARPRGICLIINNRDFGNGDLINHPRFKRREGSDIDVKRLEYIFSKLEFQIKIYTNITDAEMVRVVQDVAQNTDHTPYDAFACCILSHCKQDVVYGANCKMIRMSELTSPFRATTCPSLAGKPKIFFIQGSQGNMKMQGLKLSGPPESTRPLEEKTEEAVDASPKPIAKSDTESKASHKKDIEADIIPDEADFLFGYSSSPGFVSYRSRTQGSWYITKLAEILDSQADSKDLLSCLMMVNNEISKRNAFMEGVAFKQMPAPMFTLRRKVNLTSDPTWSRSLSSVSDQDIIC